MFRLFAAEHEADEREKLRGEGFRTVAAQNAQFERVRDLAELNR